MSAMPCGCDPEAGWVCNWHRQPAEEPLAEANRRRAEQLAQQDAAKSEEESDAPAS